MKRPTKFAVAKSKHEKPRALLARTLKAMRAAGFPVATIVIDDNGTIKVSSDNGHAPQTPAGKYLTIKEACSYGRISRSKLYVFIANGTVSASKLGKRTLIERASLDKMLRALPKMNGKRAAK